MSAITLLDGSLKLTIYQDEWEQEYDDDICLRFVEDCPEDEKLFVADEVGIYLTAEEAALIVLELNRVLDARRRGLQSG